MIGDTYKIKYSNYVLNLDGTDNGRFIEIEATDRANRPSVNTTNINHSNPAKRVPLDVVLYGHRSQGYGAPLWNNLFYLLENFAQPSESTRTFPKYAQHAIPGQIWVDTTLEPAVPRWYGRDNTFYKLGASVNVAPNSAQVASNELWFDTSTYTIKSYNLGWNDINCIPYASQREYNLLAASTNALTTIPGTLPILTGSAKPTPALWASLITNVRLLAQANGVVVPTSSVDVLAADNFMICNASVFSVATIGSLFLQLQEAVAAIHAVLYPPTRLPLAGFAASANIGTLPMVVNFIDTSTQTYVSSQDTFGPTRYMWDFGDGITSTATGNTSHTYTTAGSRVITLTLVNSIGTTSTQIRITAVGLPTAQFIVGPDTTPDIGATTPFTLTFTDQSTGLPSSWLWDFGDGTTSSDRNPTHTYSTVGEFTVSLLATNIAGSSTATVTHAVRVGEPTIANFSYTNPTRNTTDASPFSVTFTDTTTKSPSSWLWDFGDGTTSTQQNPTHTYSTWGRFTVSLTATNVLSNTAFDIGHTSVKTIVDLVSVGLAPTSAFTLTSSSQALPMVVTATDMSTNNPTSWSWNFGDGSPVVATQQASHAYTTYGTRTIALTVSNVVGAHTSSRVVVIAPPTAVPPAGTSTTPSTSGSSTSTGSQTSQTGTGVLDPNAPIEYIYAWYDAGFTTTDPSGNTTTTTTTTDSSTGNLITTTTTTDTSGNTTTTTTTSDSSGAGSTTTTTTDSSGAGSTTTGGTTTTDSSGAGSTTTTTTTSDSSGAGSTTTSDSSGAGSTTTTTTTTTSDSSGTGSTG